MTGESFSKPPEDQILQERIKNTFSDQEGRLDTYLKFLPPLSQTFQEYVLKPLKFSSEKNKKIQVILVGCGSEGAFEALAMLIAAKNEKIKANIVGIDIKDIGEDEDIGLPAARNEWDLLVRAGIVNTHDASFIKADATDPNTLNQNRDKSIPLVLIMRNPYIGGQKDIVKNCLNTIREWHEVGTDAKFLITTWGDKTEKEGINKSVAESMHDFPDKNLQVLFGPNYPNRYQTGDPFATHNDAFITVLGYQQ